jgi:hypothetical protein
MDDVLTGFYTDSEADGINRCRLYLQVECLSDICTAEGASLDPGLRNKPPTVTSTTKMHCPRQGLPAHARGRFGADSSKHTRAIQRQIDYGIHWAHGLNPIFEIGIHTTTHPHQRPAPSPPGTTIQPLSRRRDAFSQSQRATHLPTTALTTTRYQSRYFARRTHCSDAHSHPLQTAPC